MACFAPAEFCGPVASIPCRVKSTHWAGVSRAVYGLASAVFPASSQPFAPLSLNLLHLWLSHVLWVSCPADPESSHQCPHTHACSLVHLWEHTCVHPCVHMLSGTLVRAHTCPSVCTHCSLVYSGHTCLTMCTHAFSYTRDTRAHLCAHTLSAPTPPGPQSPAPSASFVHLLQHWEVGFSILPLKTQELNAINQAWRV